MARMIVVQSIESRVLDKCPKFLLLSFNLTMENRYRRAAGLCCDERREQARTVSQSMNASVDGKL